MKSVTRLMPWVLALVLPAMAFGQGIVGTDHDLRSSLSIDQICLPCHVPHNAQTTTSGDSMILWNHELTNQTFQMYSPLASGRTITGQPDGPSKLCLSCHDGVTAIDNYGGTTGGVQLMPGTAGDPGSANLGTDLRDDHPIGIAYPTSDTGYNDKTGLQGVILVTVGGEADRVECNSCHDPHVNTNSPFLRLPVTGSEICLECHNK